MRRSRDGTSTTRTRPRRRDERSTSDGDQGESVAAAALVPHGFRMPAEWEPHHATWLVWPHARADWEVKTAAVEWCYTDIVRYLVRGERAAIIYSDDAVRRRAERRLRRTGVDPERIDAHVIPTDRSWVRDCGPIFVVRGEDDQRTVAATDWRFNGWARYRAWERDDALPGAIAGRLGMRRFEIGTDTDRGPRGVVLEGGSIDVNGQGLLLTTEECLLGHDQARNPGLPRSVLERVLRRVLGIQRVLWLGRGIAGDDTHGHVDDVARFVRPDTVVAAVEHDIRDDNYAPLAENLRRLRTMHDLQGRPLRVITVPMPTASLLRRAAPAGELPEFLYRQRRGARADLQRSGGPRGARHPGRVVSGPRGGRHPCRRSDPRTRSRALHHATAAPADAMRPRRGRAPRHRRRSELVLFGRTVEPVEAVDGNRRVVDGQRPASECEHRRTPRREQVSRRRGQGAREHRKRERGVRVHGNLVGVHGQFAPALRLVQGGAGGAAEVRRIGDDLKRVAVSPGAGTTKVGLHARLVDEVLRGAAAQYDRGRPRTADHEVRRLDDVADYIDQPALRTCVPGLGKPHSDRRIGYRGAEQGNRCLVGRGEDAVAPRFVPEAAPEPVEVLASGIRPRFEFAREPGDPVVVVDELVLVDIGVVNAIDACCLQCAVVRPRRADEVSSGRAFRADRGTGWRRSR